MRRKKNLELRIKNCGEYFVDLRRDSCRDTRVDNIHEYIDFKKMFSNDNDVYLEIGCGKGQFACDKALQNPNINIIAVEKCDNVLVHASETAIEKNIKNVRFVCCGAEYLSRYIKEGSISGLYLNFSCPFPKKSYANHRLTATRFLKIYKLLLKNDARIYQKTDNRPFFEFSVEHLSDFGYTIEKILLDLHNSDFEDNIVTEYEAKFTALGYPIYYLQAYYKK